MYEIYQAGQDTFYLQSPAKIGILRLNDTDVCLIDSGSDKDAGRKIRRIIDDRHWRLTAIYNTHSNADHIGGNQYLQQQTGCKIFAPDIECDFTNHPLLEPAFLYGGNPPPELRHKFLLAQESRAMTLSTADLPSSLDVIRLPGHFFNMVGFRTKDDVVFLADCLSGKEVLEKYQIPFIYDIAAYLETLETVKSMKAALFVPSHAQPTPDIRALAQYNQDHVRNIGDHIVKCCQNGKTFETLLQTLFDDFKLTMTFEQHALIGSTVRSYLTWLKDAGRLSVIFKDHLMFWHAS